jgi:hypothetical protein
MGRFILSALRAVLVASFVSEHFERMQSYLLILSHSSQNHKLESSSSKDRVLSQDGITMAVTQKGPVPELFPRRQRHMTP